MTSRQNKSYVCTWEHFITSCYTTLFSSHFHYSRYLANKNMPKLVITETRNDGGIDHPFQELLASHRGRQNEKLSNISSLAKKNSNHSYPYANLLSASEPQAFPYQVSLFNQHNFNFIS